MDNFVIKPNLPHNVSRVILGEGYKTLLDFPLRALNIMPMYLPANPFVDKRLAFHCDLSVFHLGGSRFYLAPYLKNSDFAEELKDLGGEIIFPHIVQRAEYPGDAQLNVCALPDTAIAAPGVSSNELLSAIQAQGKNIIPCKQGYCKCSCCVVDSKAIITSDRGIAMAAEKNGIQALLIRPGFISLKGFEYGFIGGSCFLCAKDKMAFTGILDCHPDRDLILNFLAQRGISPIYLTHEPIFDIGSAIPVSEKYYKESGNE